MTPCPVLAEALDQPWLAQYDTLDKMLESRPQIYEGLVGALPHRDTTTHWIEVLLAHDVWCAPVQNYEQLVDDPQVAHNGLFWEVPVGDGEATFRTPGLADHVLGDAGGNRPRRSALGPAHGRGAARRVVALGRVTAAPRRDARRAPSRGGRRPGRRAARSRPCGAARRGTARRWAVVRRDHVPHLVGTRRPCGDSGGAPGDPARRRHGPRRGAGRRWRSKRVRTSPSHPARAPRLVRAALARGLPMLPGTCTPSDDRGRARGSGCGC